MNPQRSGGQKNEPTKMGPERLERADFGTYCTQKAGMPRKLAFLTLKLKALDFN